MGRTQQHQFEIIIDFMEKHGDIQWTCRGGERERKWHQLSNLLNSHTPKAEAKSLDQWRKIWSDFKNNTKRKEHKLIKRNISTSGLFSILELRTLELMKKRNNTGNYTSMDGNSLQVKMQEDDETNVISSPPQTSFASVDEHDYATQDSEQSTSPKAPFSRANSEEPVIILPPRKKRKREEIPDNVREVTERFFEYEREKDKMAHEQEMARLKQNEQLLTIVGKMVNVLENVAPILQKYLDQNAKGDG